MIKAEDLVYEAEREEFEILGNQYCYLCEAPLTFLEWSCNGGICDECWDKEHSEFEIYDWGDDDE